MFAIVVRDFFAFLVVCACVATVVTVFLNKKK